MKKKFKFLSILSSIFGVGAICGLFALSTFNYNKIEETKADTLIMVSQGGVDFTIQSDLVNNLSFHVYGNYSYNRAYFTNVDGYTFSFSLSYDLIETIDDEDYIYPIYLDNARTQTTQTFSTGILNGYVDGLEVKEVSNLNLELSLWYNDTLSDGVYPVIPCIRFLCNKETGYPYYEPLDFLNRPLYRNPWYTEYYIDLDNPIDYEDYLLFTQWSDLGVINIDNNTDPYVEGYNDGYNAGNISGYNDGLIVGTNQGYNQGLLEGKEEQLEIDTPLFTQYYNDGYSDGYSSAQNQDGVTTSVINGILQVGFVPVNFFLSILNFEVLGINLKGLVTGILTIALVLIVWRMIVSGKSGGD